jgi:hypothetical protein
MVAVAVTFVPQCDGDERRQIQILAIFWASYSLFLSHFPGLF